MHCETVIANFHSYLEQPTEWVNTIKDISAHLHKCEYCRKDCQKLLSTFPRDLDIASKLNQLEWQELKVLINQTPSSNENQITPLNDKPTNLILGYTLSSYSTWNKNLAVAALIFVTTGFSLTYYHYLSVNKTDKNLITNQQIICKNTFSKSEKINSIESVSALSTLSTNSSAIKQRVKPSCKTPCKIKLPAKNKIPPPQSASSDPLDSKVNSPSKNLQQNPQPTFFDTALFNFMLSPCQQYTYKLINLDL